MLYFLAHVLVKDINCSVPSTTVPLPAIKTKFLYFFLIIFTSLLKNFLYLFFNRSNFGCPSIANFTFLFFILGSLSLSFSPHKINVLISLKKNLNIMFLLQNYQIMTLDPLHLKLLHGYFYQYFSA